MKKIVFMSLLFFVAFSFACGSTRKSQPGGADEVAASSPSYKVPPVAREENPPETATIPPTPSKEESRVERIKNLRTEWEKIKNPTEDWNAELRNTTDCLKRGRFFKVRSFYGDIIGAYENSGTLIKIGAQDVGVKTEEVRSLYIKSAKEWVDVLIKATRSSFPVEYCGEGEGSIQMHDHLRVAEEIVRTLGDPKYQDAQLVINPKEVGLSALTLRNTLKEAVKQKVSEWRKNPEGGSHYDIENAMREYNLSPQEIGLTAEDYKKLREEASKH